MEGCDSVIGTTKQNVRGTNPRGWCIHEEEGPESYKSAENTCRYLATTPRRASINAAVDSDSVCGQVDWCNTAWHCGHSETNACSAGVEHDGVLQTEAEWLDPNGGVASMTRSADLFANVGMKEFGIKPVHLTGQALRDMVIHGVGSGCFSHFDVTHAFNVPGGHTDGEHFPWDWWFARANETFNGIHPQPHPDPTTQETQDMTTVLNADGSHETFGYKPSTHAIEHSWIAAANPVDSDYVELRSTGKDATGKPHYTPGFVGFAGAEFQDGDPNKVLVVYGREGLSDDLWCIFRQPDFTWGDWLKVADLQKLFSATK